MNSENHLIIVAGGKGLRMGTEIPKQFLLLEGLPVVMHTINRFVDALERLKVVLVLPSDQISYWEALVSAHQFKFPVVVAEGGPTRFHSVKSGLAKIAGAGLVGLHDAVRPLVSVETIHRCFKKANDEGNATPVIAVNDSLRIVEGETNRRVDRSLYKRIQTPQVFQVPLIKEAFEQGYDDAFTDDASVLEKMGHQIHLVEGNEENIKITQPADLWLASAILNAKNL